MKKTILTLTFAIITMVSLGQITISFRDGKSLDIKGELIVSYNKYSWDTPAELEKVYQVFREEQGDKIILSIYSIWKTKPNEGRMDELVVYTLEKKQVKDVYGVSDETDDNDKITHYSLTLQHKDDEPFPYEVYSIYSSTPEKRSGNLITINSDNKEPLEELSKLFTP